MLKIGKQCFVFLLLLVLFTTPLRAQKFVAGLHLGGIISQVDGDESSGYKKPGLFVGTFVAFPFKEKNIKLQAELNYAQKGSLNNAIQYKIALHQIEGTVLFGWNFWKGLAIEVGPSFNFLVSAKELLDKEDTEIQKFYFFELGGVVGLSYRFLEHYSFEFRFNGSISPIGRNAIERGTRKLSRYMRNNALQIHFSYWF